MNMTWWGTALIAFVGAVLWKLLAAGYRRYVAWREAYRARMRQETESRARRDINDLQLSWYRDFDQVRERERERIERGGLDAMGRSMGDGKPGVRVP
jgi:hypothetical protein